MRILFGLCVLLCLPTVVAAERIESFVSDVTVSDTGSVHITETIEYDFEDASRRGIFREIPLTHPQHSGSWYQNRVVHISVVDVERDGRDEPYALTGSGDMFRVRIGDPDVTISGSHTYTITYTVSGALTYYDTGIDFYWNVTGDGWTVPIDEVSATVRAADGILLPTASCYVGQAGATESCTQATTTGTSATFHASDIAAGSGLTIAQALNPELVARHIHTEWNLWWVWLSVGVLWVLALAYASYRIYTKHNPQHTVVAQYEPYGEYAPMFTGVLIDGQLNSRDITAGLLHLAERGFLKIHKTERTVVFIFEATDYEIELLRDLAQDTSESEQELLTLLFGAAATVGTRVALSSLKKDTAKQRENQKVLVRLRSGVDADLLSHGFYESSYGPLLAKAGIAVGLLAAATGGVVLLALATGLLFIGTFILAVLTIICIAAVAKRRTGSGYEARTYLLGFKEFLSVTDAERFKFHDAPDKTPEQFTQYLPYAVAFGVEKEWAEVFKDVTIPQPSWYDGGAAGAHFVATDLVSDLGGFSQSFSQSSGSSASSGSGTAGGGAGGGGGGSW